MGSKKKILIRYPVYVTLFILMMDLTIYYLLGYINGKYPTYEQPVLFQMIYLSLALVAFVCFVLGAAMLVQQKLFLWKVVSAILITLTLIVVIFCLLGIASVNFF